MRQQLIGPACDGELGMSPLERYPTGVLYPVEPGASGIDPASADHVEESDPALLEDREEEISTDVESKEQPLAQPVRRRRYVPPSSVGFSFFVRGEAHLSITASAAFYQGVKERGVGGRFQSQHYERIKLDEHNVSWLKSETAGNPIPIWEDRAGIHIQSRPLRNGAGAIFTVALFNRQRIDEGASPRQRGQNRAESSLFEAKIECVVEVGELLEYPRVDPSLLTEEEQELELQYKEHSIYAVGHGAAVNWDMPPGGKPRIWSEFMPKAEVRLVTNTVDDGDERGKRIRSFDYLANGPRERLFEELEYFVNGYDRWIAKQKSVSERLDAGERNVAERICEKMEVALKRMRRGLALLRSEPLAAESFQLANRAMFDQMRQAGRVGGKEAKAKDYGWRPFQLAFLLTVMESAIREDDSYRDVLDLIWFPTGGGKTEAYLGLIAFLIVWRRLKYSESGGGTAVFMRYTLRLLTRQQFERAACMICALELIRRENPERLGEEPVSVGIWVGGEISPNRFVEAMECVRDIKAGKPTARHELLLKACPWCGVQFDTASSYSATESDFHFLCANSECDFGADHSPLPCNVVDDALYANPPSLLIATIDKFARLAWEGRSGALFGICTGAARGPRRPPELIIQDELHLITGPLGSVAGLYEAGIDVLLSLLANRGARPKYIASTATIRMARQQVRRLYARDLAVFPPSGLSCDDSYFARTNDEGPGRLYVGYLAPMLDQQHCLSPLAAALLTGPLAVFDDDQERDMLLEAWWTQVIYHGSLKGVSNTHNAYETGVRDLARRLLSELQQVRRSGVFDEDSHNALESPESNDNSERIKRPRIAQLTSMRTAEENAATFDQLAITRKKKDCLDAVLATNMVSVGLDVTRLSLMVVNGQPLTTAEYIQASSRVGRGEVPGLVFANYYRNQARSLSHYENFRPYHESFYRFVEPSSVTPYTYQVRSRALHAALVIVLRHVCSRLRNNDAAGEFDPDLPRIEEAVERLKQRCAQALGSDPRQADDTKKHIKHLVDQWRSEALRCKDALRKLKYQTTERSADRLLYRYGESRPGLWRTLDSMRNVENMGMLKRHG